MKNILIIGHGSEGLTAAVNQLRDNMVTARPNLPASMKAPFNELTGPEPIVITAPPVIAPGIAPSGKQSRRQRRAAARKKR